MCNNDCKYTVVLKSEDGKLYFKTYLEKDGAYDYMIASIIYGLLEQTWVINPDGTIHSYYSWKLYQMELQDDDSLRRIDWEDSTNNEW